MQTQSKKDFKNLAKKFCEFLRFLLIIFLLFANGLEAALTLGNINYEFPSAKSLDNPMHLKEGLKSFGFLSQVGGVAFGGIAENYSGLKIKNLLYNSNNPDGNRLEIIFTNNSGEDRKISADIYDWQLIPIVNFAATDQHACFTIFGSLTDAQDEKRRLKEKQKICNYHPAFENTLMGLRLLQTDILIIRPDAADLPRDNGEYILGAGEYAPDINDNQKKIYNLAMFLDGKPKFTSYIICDYNRKITFDIKNGKLELTGYPIWHCWKRNDKDTDELIQLQKDAFKVLEEEYNKDRRTMTTWDFNFKYSEENQQKRLELILDDILSEKMIEQMTAYSEELSNEIQRQNGVNPAVYNTLITMMRYSAFFRYAQANAPEIFKKFHNSIKTVEIYPYVKTPTAMLDER